MKQIVIIGGGASGLMAGIQAARKGAAVTILEKCDKPGKKILATGNGRCNLTNRNQQLSCYHGDQKMISEILNQWSADDTLAFFHELGLWTKERDGWVYPRTDQAVSVLQLLTQEFSRLKGKLKTNEEVTEIKVHSQSAKTGSSFNKQETAGSPTASDKQNSSNSTDKPFTVYTKGWHYDADAVIIASGSPASNIEGVSEDALQLASGFGIASEEFRPSLVPLKCVRENWFAKWAGVRAQAELKLICEDKTVQTEIGEVQLTDYGISGIPVFQLSSKAGELLAKGKKPVVEMNFFPDLSLSEIRDELSLLSQKYPDKRPEQLLTGLLPDKLIAAFCGKKTKLDEVLSKASCCRVRIASLGPLKQAQICAGGILLKELTSDMEAKKVPGLFFTGECTNTDGRCGGYNLQWAWSTGAIAGRKAAC